MSTKEPMNDTAVSDTCAFAMHLPELARQQHAPAVIHALMSAQLVQTVAQCHWTEIDIAQEGDFSDDVHNGRDPSVLPSSGEEEVGVV